MTPAEKRECEAKLVEEYYNKSLKFRTAENLEAYNKLQNWFLEKYGVLWISCVKDGVKR